MALIVVSLKTGHMYYYFPMKGRPYVRMRGMTVRSREKRENILGISENFNKKIPKDPPFPI